MAETGPNPDHSVPSDTPRPTYPLSGGCHCHRIRYQLLQPPIFVNCCHCRDCQRLTGSAFAVNIMTEASNLRVTGETDPVGRPMSDTLRCPSCNTGLWACLTRYGPGILFLKAGTLDKGELIEPNAHFFTRSMVPWIRIAEDQPRFETFPPPEYEGLWSEDMLERLERGKAERGHG